MNRSERQIKGTRNKMVASRWERWVWVASVAIACAGAAAATGDQPSLDELLEITGPRAVPSTQPAAGVDLEPDVVRALAEPEPSDVFGQAVREMDLVADRIGDRFDAGLETQRLQESILAKLDQAIAAAKKQGRGSKSGSGSSSGGQPQPQEAGSAQNAQQQRGPLSDGASPGTGSGTGSGGTGQAIDQHQTVLRADRDGWGDLPARVRDDLLQGLHERFSSVYQELTGEYYRRLAQEEQ